MSTRTNYWTRPPGATKDAVLEAFKAGYRHIDSAAAYRNEAGVGEAIRASGIPRSEIFYTTKIPTPVLREGYEATKEQIEKSLKTADVEYIDLLLLHAPYGGPTARKGAVCHPARTRGSCDSTASFIHMYGRGIITNFDDI